MFWQYCFNISKSHLNVDSSKKFCIFILIKEFQSEIFFYEEVSASFLPYTLTDMLILVDYSSIDFQR